MTFDELRKWGSVMLAPGFNGFTDTERNEAVRRLFPLLVDLAEAVIREADGKPRSYELVYGQVSRALAVDALRAAMNPEPEPKPCPVCGMGAENAGDCCGRLENLLCTRPAGHSGDHCAHGDPGKRIASWPNEGDIISGRAVVNPDPIRFGDCEIHGVNRNLRPGAILRCTCKETK